MRRSLLELEARDGSAIVATVTEPAGEPGSTLVLSPVGFHPRAGINRADVRLAHRLAERGHRVVRADLCGLGEAGGASPTHTLKDQWREIGAGLFVDDYIRVLEAARTGHERLPLIAAGTCGGGSTAVYAAARLPWVDGVFTLGLPFRRRDVRVPPGVGRGEQRRHAARELARRRARLPGASYGKLARLVAYSLWPRRPRARLHPEDEAWLNLALLDAVRALDGRPLALAYGADDLAYGEARSYALGLGGLAALPGLSVFELAGVGHQLDVPASVDALAEVADGWLRQCVPSGPGYANMCS